ncbi:GNAT family N-acetyltransferase [Haloplanus halobius]|uniref:GNAT family N-acetyltransferase n=1 Tax=Haloplanus halobius TaxID=2934938 RepID=UPI00201073D2|nr:GNAT family N-acetyltransferase [Haloplanus sp. XH21]
MAFALLGWPPDGPTLRLDYRRFAYAGKFVLGATGKAVVYDANAAAEDSAYDDAVLAAASFSPDRTDDDCLCVRYITVRDDRQGDGLGSRLLAFVADCAEARGFDRLRIAVNNPVAYRAAYRAGFGFTGDETGLAELVCERPGPRDAETYRDGLERYRGREFDDEMASFLDDERGSDPPAVVDPPDGVGVVDGDVVPWQ